MDLFEICQKFKEKKRIEGGSGNKIGYNVLNVNNDLIRNRFKKNCKSPLGYCRSTRNKAAFVYFPNNKKTYNTILLFFKENKLPISEKSEQ